MGVGNILMADEGVGVRVVQRLKKEYILPPEVNVVDGGTLGMDLLYYLTEARNLVIIDAVEMAGEPGQTLRLEGDDVPARLSLKMSPHQMGIPDMLFAAKLRDLYPEQVVLLGVQPGVLEPSLDMSPPVAAQVEGLINQIGRELKQWGLIIHKR
ncbi:MAG: HyaD/HybD family hydrogenase maturation endopeptidase [Anaerolineae bacterium]|nr:HyaD/HybD family hydrogenase maturation endopeptidase [Anaerolineae bacterium]